MCQETNHTPKKLREKLVMQTVDQFILSVTIVEKSQLQNHLTTIEKKDTTAQMDVMQKTEKKTGNQKNRPLGRVELRHIKHTGDGSKVTQNIWLILRPGDMQDKKMQKDHILLKNGRKLRECMDINVLLVKNLKNLQKTILNHCLSVEQTIYQTFSRCAGVATVASGRSFNIYENPELLASNQESK